MFGRARVAVVVPAYNEARLIGRTLGSVPAWVDHVVVVDDGSTDGTSEAVRALADPRVTLIRHEDNRGAGAALATGYGAAFDAGADVAAVMAGDAQMDPQDLPALLAPVLAGEAEYAKGDRLSFPDARERMPFVRWLGNHVLTVLTQIAIGRRVCDSQCGYTALSRAAAERVGLERLWPRYGYPNDLLGRIAAAGLRVCDVSVRPVYADEQSGIGWRHALFVVPWVLARVMVRRVASRRLRKPSRARVYSFE